MHHPPRLCQGFLESRNQRSTLISHTVFLVTPNPRVGLRFSHRFPTVMFNLKVGLRFVQHLSILPSLFLTEFFTVPFNPKGSPNLSRLSNHAKSKCRPSFLTVSF